MTLPRIIGITGYARHGKDTVAQVLTRELGYSRVALADKMKEALYALDPIIGVKWKLNGFGDGDNVRLAGYVDANGWDEAKKMPEVRALLQRFGTEVGRNMLGEDVWIGALAKGTKGFYGNERRIVIPDIRFSNEAAFIRRMHGEVWKVERPNFDNGVGTGHASESEIGPIVGDVDFCNDLDLAYLEGQVLRYLKARTRFSVGPSTPLTQDALDDALAGLE